MPRSYSVRIAALALDIDRKWLDNLLSRCPLPGVSRGGQGIERRLSEDALVAIEICRILNLELGVSMHQAAGLAVRALGDPGADAVRHETKSGLSLQLPLEPVRRRLQASMLEMVEAVPERTRGRPRSRRVAE